MDSASRLQHLEEQLAFQQRLLDQFHEELVTQRAEILELRRANAACQRAVEAWRSEATEENLPFDKPPHY